MEVEMKSAEALDRYIDQGLPDGFDAPSPEMALVDLLKETAEAMPAEAGFKKRLYQDVIRSSAAKKTAGALPEKTHFLDWMRGPRLVAAAALIILLLAFFAYPSLSPFQNVDQTMLTPDIGVTASGIQESVDLNKPLLPLFGVSSVKAATQDGGSKIRPEYVLEAAFPSSPAGVQVFEQKPNQALTPEEARAAALRLGIEGGVFFTDYRNPSMNSLTVIDAGAMVTFSTSTNDFTYEMFPARTPAHPTEKSLSFSERSLIAEEFLKKSAYLDFPYITAPDRLNEVIVNIKPLYGGYPLLQSGGDDGISAQVLADGRISYLTYHKTEVQAVGEYPIRTAEEAWKIIEDNRFDGRVRESYSFIKPVQFPPGRSKNEWVRPLLPGSRGEIYGYLRILAPLESQTVPWISIDNIPLSGDLHSFYEELRSINAESGINMPGGVSPMSDLYHVWGTFQQGNSGEEVTLNLEGWEKSNQTYGTIGGTVERKDGKAWFTDESGKKLWLPDLPGDVPEGVNLKVDGVALADPDRFEWNLIMIAPIGGGFGGGGGGGGGAFAFNPAGDSGPIPTPEPLPWQAGDRLDGVVGGLTAIGRKDKSGVITYDDTVCIESAADGQETHCIQVKGPGRDGIEQFDHLRVRLWGTFDTVDGQPSILVERYEKAYPAEKIEAWLGVIKNQIVNGRLVQVFYDIKGNAYVLENSTMMPEALVKEDSWGDVKVVIEGMVIKGKTYGKYPLIRDLSRAMEPGRVNLNGYAIQSTQPFILDEVEFPDPWEGKITIDTIQLSYHTEILPEDIGDWEDNPGRYVQPVWLFSGRSEEGGVVTLMVQAVVDKYLTVQ